MRLEATPNNALERPRGQRLRGGQRDVAVLDKPASVSVGNAARRSATALGVEWMPSYYRAPSS